MVYIQKKARKLITDGLLGAIYKLTPLKQPADNFINNSTNNPTNNFTNNPTNNFIIALLLLLTTPI